MYIAICEDNAQQLNRLGMTVVKYAAANDIPIRFQQFSDAQSMLDAAKSRNFTHYFLDVMMPGMNGMDAAREIRKRSADARIVFMTSFKEFAYESYRVKAHDYLLKPVSEKQLFEILDQLQALEESDQECLNIRNGRSIFRIPFAQIAHLEVSQKQLYFHMTDGQIRRFPGTMSEFESELLSRPGFAKIHRSYIVNLRQVSVFSPDGCIMFSGKNLPISRLLYNQIRQEYMAHLFGNPEV